MSTTSVKRPTSRDVATLAGVSQSTVSFVFTGKSGISPATRERVLEAARALSYRPNLAARSMRTQQTGRVGAVITTASLPYTAELLEGVTSVARASGYVIELITVDAAQSARQERVREVATSGAFEAVLSFVPLPIDLLDELRDASAAVVVPVTEFDDRLHARGRLTDAQPLVEMMDRLVALGHRRFMHISGSYDFPSAVSRRDAYLRTVERLGVESIGVYDGKWQASAGFAVITGLPPDTPPFALIAANDLIATGAIQAAHVRGWSVPGRMSVTGWDDMPQSAWLAPSLTTVVQDREVVGSYAMKRVVSILRGTPPPTYPESVQRVVWRRSTGASAA